MRATLFALALLAPSAALAACPGETVLSCPIGKKQLEVCLTPTSATYTFGPRGRPELTITTHIRDLDYRPWSGVGRSMWDSVTFRNKGTDYEVWTSIDRMDPNALWEGGVNVVKGGEMLAGLSCAKGSVQTDLYSLFIAKEAAGQCWNFETFTWQMAPCPQM